MTPAASWLLILLVVAGFAVIGWQILHWIDRLLDLRFEHRHLRPHDDKRKAER